MNLFNLGERLIESVRINVKIKANINKGKDLYIVANPNQRKDLTLEHLDASPLAQKMASSPRYKVIRKSKFGSLRRNQDRKG